MSDDTTTTAIDRLRDEIESLKQQLAALQDDRRRHDTDAASEPPLERSTASRRGLLRLAGATAVGAVASSALAGRAAADVGYSTVVSTAATDVVRQQLTASHPGRAGFVFATVSTPPLTGNDSLFGAAVAAWNYDPAVDCGLYALNTQSGAALVAQSTAPSATAIRTVNTGGGASIGVSAFIGGPAAGSVAVLGTAETGVRGTSTLADRGVGVEGRGAFGVIGDGDTGVSANGLSVGVEANGAVGLGVRTGGAGGAINLRPVVDAAPPARTTAYIRGTLDVDANGDVWYCYQAGSPGRWRKLTGASTAGAFHALTPGRVYDSREPIPAPGPLSGGEHRTISVADRRNPEGGAVAAANFVPAGATAVAANITVASVAGRGFLAVNPGGITAVTASTINWSGPDQAIANGVILALNPNRELTIVAGGGTTHVVVDITGYWL